MKPLLFVFTLLVGTGLRPRASAASLTGRYLGTTAGARMGMSTLRPGGSAEIRSNR